MVGRLREGDEGAEGPPQAPGEARGRARDDRRVADPADPDWIYVVDDDGDVVRTPRAGTAASEPPDDVEWFAPTAALVTVRAPQAQPLARNDDLLAEDLARFA
jgi:hypothetical protein